MPKPSLLLAVLLVGACEGTTPPLPNQSQEPPPAVPRARPRVTPMAAGGLMLRAPIAEVQSLERQPDGSYRRICARPDDQQRASMERPFRARR